MLVIMQDFYKGEIQELASEIYKFTYVSVLLASLACYSAKSRDKLVNLFCLHLYFWLASLFIVYEINPLFLSFYS